MSSESKRIKMDRKGKSGKINYYMKAKNDFRKKSYLEPGQRGFLITCNNREKDCIRDSFRLLNEYADELYGKLIQVSQSQAVEKTDDEEEDISISLSKQVEATKSDKPTYRFYSIETGSKNCCFIKTTLENPMELGLKILHDLADTKQIKSRNILRFLPIEVITKANLKDIINAAGALFDKCFLKQPKTYSIIFNRRCNNELKRDSVINELATLISSKNPGNKVNLKNPDFAIMVEVIKGLCLISVLPEYYELKKYNLVEICAQDKTEQKASTNEKESDTEKEITSLHKQQNTELNAEIGIEIG